MHSETSVIMRCSIVVLVYGLFPDARRLRRTVRNFSILAELSVFIPKRNVFKIVLCFFKSFSLNSEL